MQKVRDEYSFEGEVVDKRDESRRQCARGSVISFAHLQSGVYTTETVRLERLALQSV
jgi:hypothetical protein